LLHRDIKAQNVMQNEDGRVVLMDFGTGRELMSPSSSSINTAGTPLYLAPEIFSGLPATVQSDVYSVGVLLFHLWTGGYPVRGSNIQEVRAAHARGQRVDVLAPTRATRSLAAAIGRAIEPTPARRFLSARQLLAALENVQSSSASRTRKRAWLAGAALVLVAIALGVAASLAGRRQPPRNGRDGSRPSAYFGVTAEKRAVQLPRLILPGTPSPDGRFFPYSEWGTGNLALYEFASGTSRTLTKDADGGDVRWAFDSIVSEDSGRVAFNWADPACDCTQLRVIDVNGENERVLYGGRGSREIDPQEFSRDGSQILGTRPGDSGGTEAVLLSISDGSVSTVRSLGNVGMVTRSPDGRFLAYSRTEDANDSDSGIYVAALDDGAEVAAVTGPTYDSHPMWTPDGTGLVFASLRTGGPSLWLQPVEEGHPKGKPRLLDKDMGPFAPYTLTRQGSLFYDHRTGLMDVYIATIDPATGDVVGEPKNAANRFLGSNISADWSPDGEWLAFASWRSLFGPGSNILVFHSTKTGQERELELDLAVANGVSWTPDGRFITVRGPDRKGIRALRQVDPASGKIVSTRNGAYGSLAWDTNGVHAYVRKNSGIVRLDVDDGRETALYTAPEKSVPGAIALSPDGRWLVHSIFMQETRSPELILIPTSGGQIRTLVTLPGSSVMLGLGGWTRDGRHVIFVQTGRDSEEKHVGELWAVPFEGGTPRRLGLSMRALRDVRVSPDGTRISFTAGYPDREMWVFENFLPKAASSLTYPAAETENPPKEPAPQTKRSQ
jgi:Tol biopolymer transport system component